MKSPGQLPPLPFSRLFGVLFWACLCRIEQTSGRRERIVRNGIRLDSPPRCGRRTPIRRSPLMLGNTMNTVTRLSVTTGVTPLSAPAIAQITFYEGLGFCGRALTADLALPSLKRGGINTFSSSAVVERGTRKVCSDAGAVISDMPGHQLGDRNGRAAATVGGAAVATVIGSRAGRIRDDGCGHAGHGLDLQRCETVDRGAPAYPDVSQGLGGVACWLRKTDPPSRMIAVNRRGEPRQQECRDYAPIV